MRRTQSPGWAAALAVAVIALLGVLVGLAPSAGAAPQAVGTITEYPAPTGTVANPQGVATDAAGNVWFANYGANKIGRMTPSGQYSTYSAPALINPTSVISAGGAIWFTARGDSWGGRIGRINTQSGVIQSWPSSSLKEPGGLAMGPDGNIWFTSIGNNRVGRFNTTTHQFSTWAAGAVQPSGITAGSDGNLWFTGFDAAQPNVVGRIGRITTQGVVTTVPTPTVKWPIAITQGPDGNLWFNGDTQIGRLNPATMQVTATFPGQGTGIRTGADGALWYQRNGGIGRITTSGVTTVYPLIGSGYRFANTLAPSPNGQYLYFANSFGNRMGRVQVLP